MNLMIRKQFDIMADQVAELRALLEKSRAEAKKNIEEALADKDDLRQDLWRYRKETTTLNRIKEDYNRLEDENIALREERKVLRGGLERVLDSARALSRVHKP